MAAGHVLADLVGSVDLSKVAEYGDEGSSGEGGSSTDSGSGPSGGVHEDEDEGREHVVVGGGAMVAIGGSRDSVGGGKDKRPPTDQPRIHVV